MVVEMQIFRACVRGFSECSDYGLRLSSQKSLDPGTADEANRLTQFTSAGDPGCQNRSRWRLKVVVDGVTGDPVARQRQAHRRTGMSVCLDELRVNLVRERDLEPGNLEAEIEESSSGEKGKNRVPVSTA